ncbi:hypothetical protein ABZ372_46225, partial [Streptomyces sp. NPDC005921]
MTVHPPQRSTIAGEAAAPSRPDEDTAPGRDTGTERIPPRVAREPGTPRPRPRPRVLTTRSVPPGESLDYWHDAVLDTLVGMDIATEGRTYDGRDAFPILRERYEALRDKPTDDINGLRALHLAVAMESIPSDYFNYYYFRDEILRERQLAEKTRSEIIMDALPGYWQHYREQADSDAPQLRQECSRGGIHELELAIDAISAYYNDAPIRQPFNITNTGGWLPGFEDSTVVELWGTVDGKGFHPEKQKPLPHSVLGITQQLAEYQILTAKAGWEGDVADAVRAMTANPLVPSLSVAEALYAEMAHAQRAWLPERLLPSVWDAFEAEPGRIKDG